jgi:hypothetical protein
MGVSVLVGIVVGRLAHDPAPGLGADADPSERRRAEARDRVARANSRARLAEVMMAAELRAPRRPPTHLRPVP